MAAEQHLRLAGAAAAARRRHEPDGEQAGRGAEIDPRAAGAASAESVVQQLSLGRSIRSGSRWRISTSSADGGRSTKRGKPVDASGTTVSGAKVDGLSGTAGAAARAARTVSAHGHRKAAGLRARPASRVLRSAGGEKDRPRRRGARLPLVVARAGDCEEPAVSDAGSGGVEAPAAALGVASDFEARRREVDGLGNRVWQLRTALSSRTGARSRSIRHVHHQDVVAATDRPAGPGRDAGAAVARGDAARLLAARAGGREAGASVPGVLCAERHGDGVLDAEG